MILLYETAPSPTCRAVKMILRLLGLDFNVKEIDLMKKEQMTPEYLKVNPFHTVPSIDDDGFVLYESRAIMTYLVNKYAPDSDLYPADPQKRALVDQFLHTDSGTILARGVDILHSYFLKREPSEEMISKAKDGLGTLDGILANRTYVTGDTMTIADVSIVASLSAFSISGFDYSEFGNITKYASHIREKLSPMYGEVNDGPEAILTDIINNMKAAMKK